MEGRAAPPSVVGLDVGVILLYGGGGLLGFLIASNRLALPLRKISVRYRELRLRRLRLVTSRYGFARRARSLRTLGRQRSLAVVVSCATSTEG